MNKLLVLAFSSMLFMACGNKEKSADDFSKPETSTEATPASTPDYDPNRGEGKFDKVELGTLDATMADAGQHVAEVKCASCHKMTEERLVGPGWKGVTERRTPEWIMNFTTNPDPMIDKDPEVQAQLEICLVRMPNQGISDDEARQILEYMRQNDGAQ